MKTRCGLAALEENAGDTDRHRSLRHSPDVPLLGTALASTLLFLPPPQSASKPAVTGAMLGGATGVFAGATMMALSFERATPRLSAQGRTALFATGASIGVASLAAFAGGLSYAIGRPRSDATPREQRALRRRGIGSFVVSGLGAAAGVGCAATTVFGRGCPLGLSVGGGALAVSGALFGGVLMGLSLREPSAEPQLRGFAVSGRF